MAINNPVKNHIGLDISDFKIRLVQTSEYTSKKLTKLLSVCEATVPQGIIMDGTIINENSVTQIINQCLARPLFGKIKSNWANVSLPEKKTFIKLITIPKVPESEIRGAVSWGIEQEIPVNIEQIYFDWQTVNDPSVFDKNKIDVLVSAAPKDIVENYTKCVENTGLKVIGMENESLAISRCVTLNKPSNELNIIIDLGKSHTTVILHANQIVQYSSVLDIFGNQMTDVIANKLKLSWDDAEKAKIICGLDKLKGKGAIRQILQPQMDRLIASIQDTLTFANEYLQFDKYKPKIYLTGSVSEMTGLSEYLNQALKISTETSDPSKIFRDLKKNKTTLNLLSYATAIGLAIKKIE